MVKSQHSGYVGIRGVVIEETKNMITIRSKDGRKMVPKAVATFVFKLADGTRVEVEGRYLVGRPWDRVKRCPRRLW